MFIFAFIIFLVGLCMGSFISAVTYRIPRGEKFFAGRSHCDNCNKLIRWYDNIPLLSYILLNGKCRNCGKKISPRYPVIEASTAFLFLLIYWLKILPDLNIYLALYYFAVAVILLLIFVIDLEAQIIPDQLVLLLILINLFMLIVTSNDKLYTLLFTGFSASLFLLLINLVTKGRGMGLGDVKLAIFGGLFLGYPNVITWFFLSFVIGAAVGLLLIAAKKAHFGKQIAFGPFLIFTLFLVLFWGEPLTRFLMPYL